VGGSAGASSANICVAPTCGAGAVIGGMCTFIVASAGSTGGRMRTTTSASPTVTRSPLAIARSPSTFSPLTKVPLDEPRSRTTTLPAAALTVDSGMWTAQVRLRPTTDSPSGSSTGGLPGTSTKTCHACMV